VRAGCSLNAAGNCLRIVDTDRRSGVTFSDCLALEVAGKAGHVPRGTFDRELLNTAVKFVVYVENSTAARSIMTDVVLPDGVTHVKAVLVTDAKKQFPDRMGEREW